MNEYKANMLVIYKVDMEGILKNEACIDLKDNPIFEKTCMTFFFKNNNGQDKDTLIFARID